MSGSGREESVTPARRRVAPKIEETSDVRRFRGALVGGGVVAILAFGGAIAVIGPGSLRSPGALSHSHAGAGVECASCHGKSRPREACTSCHGKKAMRRPAHARLVREQALDCVTCHGAHGRESAVRFSPGKKGAHPLAERLGSGAVTSLPATVGKEFRLPVTVTVPLIEARVCSGCHRLGDPQDPAASCFTGQGPGSWGPSTCFDEHRVVAGTFVPDAKVVPEVQAHERDAAWSAARRAALEAPSPPGSERAWGSLVPLGALLGGLGFSVLWARRRKRSRVTTAPAHRHEVGAATLSLAVGRLPVVDPNTCIGCNACVDACPYDVIELQAYVARVARPEECCGLTLCAQRCPNGSLTIEEAGVRPDLPDLDEQLQATDSPGVYLAGDLTGLPLIRTAINQGAAAMQAVADSLEGQNADSLEGQNADSLDGQNADGDTLDVAIVGAGPAGISAALMAKKLGLSALVLEQGSVAESIRSFPRGKLVFDQPLGLPMVGDLWLEESTKEELLGKWLRIVRKEALDIREGQRVVGCQLPAAPQRRFALEVTEGDGVDQAAERQLVHARRVVLAVGKRGSPRKLPVPVPDEWLGRVHYHLADAQSFSGQRVMVIGLGDVAMEAAVALARQPHTDVSISYRGDEFVRGKQRNRQAIERLTTAGKLRMLWSTEVAQFQSGDRVRLQTHQGPMTVEVDAVIVLIGSATPWALLQAFGVQRRDSRDPLP